MCIFILWHEYEGLPSRLKSHIKYQSKFALCQFSCFSWKSNRVLFWHYHVNSEESVALDWSHLTSSYSILWHHPSFRVSGLFPVERNLPKGKFSSSLCMILFYAASHGLNYPVSQLGSCSFSLISIFLWPVSLKQIHLWYNWIKMFWPILYFKRKPFAQQYTKSKGRINAAPQDSVE